MKQKLLLFLNNKKTFWFFLALASISALSTFIYGHIIGFSDEGDYWSIAEGLHHGQFSAWYHLPFETPETLRTWGYPFFLYLCQFFTNNHLFAKIVQLVFYISTVYCILRLIKHFYAPLAYRTVFMILLVFNNHLAFYAGILIAECMCIFFVTLFATVYVIKKDSYFKYVLLALICFALYQLRPVFLLFPVAMVLYSLLFNRRILKYNMVFLLAFIVTLFPFAIWNKVNHGVYKVTPLEGGWGVALQGGYWEYRLPLGFTADYYWGTNIDEDLLQPKFMTEEQKAPWAKVFLKDWQDMTEELRTKYANREDSLREILETDTGYRRNFKAYSTQYTLAREKMLKDKFIGYVKADPVFYFKTRVYVFFRQWVTGIDAGKLRAAHSIKGYMVALYPFLVTFFFILIGLFISCIALLRKKLSWKQYHVFFLFIGYIAFADLPFGVMSRYTVPVHLFILMMLSILFMNGLSKTRLSKTIEPV